MNTLSYTIDVFDGTVPLTLHCVHSLLYNRFRDHANTCLIHCPESQALVLSFRLRNWFVSLPPFSLVLLHSEKEDIHEVLGVKMLRLDHIHVRSSGS